MSNLTILNTQIRTLDGLFSLNDFHKASGENPNQRPSLFIRNNQTKDLISEIEKDQSTNLCLAQKSIRGGLNAGVWACEELVLAYAMWISPKFHLVVLRAFLAMHRNEPKQLALPETTTDDRKGLRDAITTLVNKKGLIYSEVYSLVHQQFNVSHIDELTKIQISQAVQYIHFLTLNLDTLFQKGEEINISAYIFDAIMKHAKLAQKLAEKVINYQEKQFALLGIENHFRHNELTASANSLLGEFKYFLREGETLLAKHSENPQLTQQVKLSKLDF
ncbi:KilA-N domain-containing protein [Rodentibacter caecimuris]|uniref:KilA-N domain-containing protein n=1 Tax=Rodentibacter caecimuris TaxID=1796644 RepID=UPI0027D47967|nr:KilA-N domain-containing protein [Pasteurella caecimuris]